MFLTVTLNPALDKTLWVERNLPHATLRAESVHTVAGGKGVNVARALIGLGEPAARKSVRVFFTQGGHSGAAMVELARNEGMQVMPVPVSGQTRAAITVRAAESGQYWHYLEPGPQLLEDDLSRLRAGFLAALEEVGSAGSTVIISGSVPSVEGGPLVPWMVRAAMERGARVALDASGPHVLPAYEAGPWMVKPTLSELETTLGEALVTEEDRWRALERVSGWGVELAVLSLGAEGSLAVARGERFRVASPSVVEVNDLGAGDSMVAGLCWAERRGYNLQQCLAWGTACGAANVAVWDPGRLNREDVERLLPQVAVQAA